MTDMDRAGGERERFEAWASEVPHWARCGPSLFTREVCAERAEDYMLDSLQRAWVVWQARAALSREPREEGVVVAWCVERVNGERHFASHDRAEVNWMQMRLEERHKRPFVVVPLYARPTPPATEAVRPDADFVRWAEKCVNGPETVRALEGAYGQGWADCEKQRAPATEAKCPRCDETGATDDCHNEAERVIVNEAIRDEVGRANANRAASAGAGASEGEGADGWIVARSDGSVLSVYYVGENGIAESVDHAQRLAVERVRYLNSQPHGIEGWQPYVAESFYRATRPLPPPTRVSESSSQPREQSSGEHGKPTGPTRDGDSTSTRVERAKAEFYEAARAWMDVVHGGPPTRENMARECGVYSHMTAAYRALLAAERAERGGKGE